MAGLLEEQAKMAAVKRHLVDVADSVVLLKIDAAICADKIRKLWNAGKLSCP